MLGAPKSSLLFDFLMYTLAIIPVHVRDARLSPAVVAAIKEAASLFDLFILVPRRELDREAWARISDEATELGSSIRIPVRLHQSSAADRPREWSDLAQRIGEREVERRAGRPAEARLLIDARDLDLETMPGNLDIYVPPGILVRQANDFPARVRVHRPRTVHSAPTAASHVRQTTSLRDHRRTPAHTPARVAKRDRAGRPREGSPPASPARVVRSPGPPLVALLGGPGSGKTTLGATLAAHLGGHHLSLGNVYRMGRDMHLHGWPQPWNPPDDPAWEWYQARVYGVVSRFCAEHPNQPLILDGPTGDQVLELQGICGRAITHVITLKCSADTMAQRLGARGRPDDMNPAARERRITQYERRHWHQQAGLRALRIASPGVVVVQRNAEVSEAEVAASIVTLFGPATANPGVVLAETHIMSLLSAEVAHMPMPRPDAPMRVSSARTNATPTASDNDRLAPILPLDSPSEVCRSTSPLYATEPGGAAEDATGSWASPAYSPTSPSPSYCPTSPSYPAASPSSPESPPYSAVSPLDSTAEMDVIEESLKDVPVQTSAPLEVTPEGFVVVPPHKEHNL